MVKTEGSLAAFVWRHEPGTGRARGMSATDESIALSKALKKLGWKFVGPTTVYAFMQAMGLVNDHFADCVIHAQVAKARKKFRPPKAAR
jgi:DNA-3-methyladenine glycosylase I